MVALARSAALTGDAARNHVALAVTGGRRFSARHGSGKTTTFARHHHPARLSPRQPARGAAGRRPRPGRGTRPAGLHPERGGPPRRRLARRPLPPFPRPRRGAGRVVPARLRPVRPAAAGRRRHRRRAGRGAAPHGAGLSRLRAGGTRLLRRHVRLPAEPQRRTARAGAAGAPAILAEAIAAVLPPGGPDPRLVALQVWALSHGVAMLERAGLPSPGSGAPPAERVLDSGVAALLGRR